MKQYLTQEQTAKLMELGFEKPKSIEVYREGHCAPFVEQRWEYSIGELIEMLGGAEDIEINRYDGDWSASVGYEGAKGKELIDVLFRMLVKLKEEGVI